MSRLRISFKKLPLNYKTVRIDGDILVYVIGFAVEDKIEWPDGTVDVAGDLNLAKHLLNNRIRHITNSIGPGIDYKFVISGDAPNWRKALDSGYKSSRGRKPMDYNGIRKYMRTLDTFIETTNGLEADDLLASVASADPEHTAIVSFDKDFFTVPGTFIHLAQNSSARLYQITPTQALCFLMFQAIAGDPVDSYTGVSKIGKKKAAQLLELAEIKEFTVRQMYLHLKASIKKYERKFANTVSKDGQYPARNLWDQFRKCLDLAALTLEGETPSKGIGLRRVYKHRTERMSFFLPYFNPAHTYEFTNVKM